MRKRERDGGRKCYPQGFAETPLNDEGPPCTTTGPLYKQLLRLRQHVVRDRKSGTTIDEQAQKASNVVQVYRLGYIV